jgi:hypothetical protein
LLLPLLLLPPLPLPLLLLLLLLLPLPPFAASAAVDRCTMTGRCETS